jgi:hypothetical protein
MTRAKIGLLSLAAGLLLLACAEEDGSSQKIDWELDPCGFAEAPSGTIDIASFSDYFHGDIVAHISASLRPAPNPTFHEVLMEQGACRYYKSAIGTCDPACEGGEFCTVDDECVTYPATIGGGTLEITGLQEPIEIEPTSYSPGTYFGPTPLPGELFQPGDRIGARLEGDEFPALALGAEGVALMDTALTDNGYEMLDGQDAEITWTPGPSPDACVQLVINGFNQVHGAPLDNFIVCEGADTGSMTIPQAFVEEFPYGETPPVTEGFDWPHSELTRYTRNSADTEVGRAEIVVRSTAYFQPSHPDPN